MVSRYPRLCVGGFAIRGIQAGCNVTDAGMIHLSKAPQLKRLVAFRTAGGGGHITDTGISRLGAIETLRFIDVSGNKVTPQGVQALQARLPECEVKIATLGATAVTSDEGSLIEESSRSVDVFSRNNKPVDSAIGKAAGTAAAPKSDMAPTDRLQMDLQHAIALRNDRQFQAAIVCLKRVVEADANHIHGNVLLAHMLYAVGENDAALPVYQHIADVMLRVPADKRPVGDWGFLGQSLYRLGRFEEARQALERAIFGFGETVPKVDKGPRWWFLVMTLEQLDEHELAVRYYQELVSQVDANTPTLHRMAYEEVSKIMSNFSSNGGE